MYNCIEYQTTIIIDDNLLREILKLWNDRIWYIDVCCLKVKEYKAVKKTKDVQNLLLLLQSQTTYISIFITLKRTARFMSVIHKL